MSNESLLISLDKGDSAIIEMCCTSHLWPLTMEELSTIKLKHFWHYGQCEKANICMVSLIIKPLSETLTIQSKRMFLVVIVTCLQLNHLMHAIQLQWLGIDFHSDLPA